MGLPLRPTEENVSSQASSAECVSSACSWRESPARSPACATTASSAAISLSSLGSSNTTRDESVVIGFSQADIAGFPAIRTIIEAIDAQTDVLLRLAEAAVLVTSAFVLRLVA